MSAVPMNQRMPLGGVGNVMPCDYPNPAPSAPVNPGMTMVCQASDMPMVFPAAKNNVTDGPMNLNPDKGIGYRIIGAVESTDDEGGPE